MKLMTVTMMTDKKRWLGTLLTGGLCQASRHAHMCHFLRWLSREGRGGKYGTWVILTLFMVAAMQKSRFAVFFLLFFIYLMNNSMVSNWVRFQICWPNHFWLCCLRPSWLRHIEVGLVFRSDFNLVEVALFGWAYIWQSSGRHVGKGNTVDSGSFQELIAW